MAKFVWSTETTKFPYRYTSSAKQGCKITPGRLGLASLKKLRLNLGTVQHGTEPLAVASG
jgi:hypothetical protein